MDTETVVGKDSVQVKAEKPAAEDPLADLARRGASGDTTAMRELLTAVAPIVGRTVDALFGRTHPDRDDVAQDALLAIARALADFRGECTVAHYARQVAARRAYVMRRRGRAAKRHGEAVPFDEAEEAHAPQPRGVSPFAEITSRRRTELWLELLGKIPEAQSEVLALQVVLGFSIEEIAMTTQAPVNTVRKRIALAKAALRECLEKDPALAEELKGT